VIVVVGYQGERVRAACEGSGVEFVVQEEQLGTGHAVMQAQEALTGFDGTTLVLNGDVPCLRPETLKEFIDFHHSSGAVATVMTARMEDPSGYGRIVRDGDDSLLRIVEHKDASPDELAIDEINSGLFCFDTQALFAALNRTKTSNAQNEYYLTDAIEMLHTEGKRVSAWCVPDNDEVAGVNTVEELDAIRSAMENRS
jgi:bifunctional UDP-N-acetylglucosamine pyrophosphorylase/glucosamine-1-phosphate N-acetyltransferase